MSVMTAAEFDLQMRRKTNATKRPKPDHRGNCRPYIGNKRFNFGKDNLLSDQEFARRSSAIKDLYEKQCTTYEVDFWSAWIIPFAEQLASGAEYVDYPVSDVADLNPGQAVEEATAIGHLQQLGLRVQASRPETIFAGESRLKHLIESEITQIVKETIESVRHRHGVPTEMRERLAIHGPNDPATTEVRSFYEALAEYRIFIDKTGKRKENGQLADSPKNYQDWSRRLEEHHDDFPVWQLTKERLEEMFAYWCNRPESKHNGKRISYDYAKHILDCFWAVLTWMDEASNWSWELPKGASRIKRTPYKLASDAKKSRSRRMKGKVYTPEQLAIIAEQLNPFGKMFLGLSVNCGMQPAESGRVEWMDFFATHPETNAHGNWIVFDRPKTGEYGEWILWPEVASLIRWAIKRSKALGADRLLVTDNGESWYKDDKEWGNPTSNIGKWWQAKPCASDSHEGIVTRLERQIEGFPRHTLKSLRKILPTHIRPKYGQEIADLANARKIGEGGTVKGLVTDRYADRRYEQLAEAIDELETVFRPFLDALRIEDEPI